MGSALLNSDSADSSRFEHDVMMVACAVCTARHSSGATDFVHEKCRSRDNQARFHVAHGNNPIEAPKMFER